jgi:hypothetical protein
MQLSLVLPVDGSGSVQLAYTFGSTLCLGFSSAGSALTNTTSGVRSMKFGFVGGADPPQLPLHPTTPQSLHPPVDPPPPTAACGVNTCCEGDLGLRPGRGDVCLDFRLRKGEAAFLPGEGDIGLYEGDVGLYEGDVGLYEGDVGLYEGDVGLYEGDVGLYEGWCGPVDFLPFPFPPPPPPRPPALPVTF